MRLWDFSVRMRLQRLKISSDRNAAGINQIKIEASFDSGGRSWYMMRAKSNAKEFLTKLSRSLLVFLYSGPLMIQYLKSLTVPRTMMPSFKNFPEDEELFINWAARSDDVIPIFFLFSFFSFFLFCSLCYFFCF